MRIDEILKAAIEDVGLEFETSLDWLTSTNNETTSTSASVSVSATTTDQESSTAAQSQSIGSITPSSSHEETDESDLAANHSFFDALQQLEEHNKKLNFTYEPEIDTKLVENVQNQQQQQQQTPQQTQTIQTPTTTTTTTTTTPVVKYISIDCLKKSPGEIRADLNKLISAANITHTSTSPPIIQHQQQQKVIRMDSPLSAVATVNQRTSSPSSPFKITQVVSSRPPIQQQPTVTTNLPKTTNIVYYDKTNNRFLPIQSSTATTATNTTPKYTSVMHQPSTSNLNIKTTQRSVVTINPRFISTITTPGTQLQPPTSTTIPMISSAPNLLLHRSSSLATVSNNPPQPPTPVVDYSRFVVEQQDEEVIVEEEDELGHAETYANYMPSKLRIGLSHPDPIVETSSLASVEPPDIRYKLKMPKSVYDKGALSALQLESIVYASQKHEEFLPNAHRCGFLIGDGAGVGKGRTIAGIIYENYLLGRKKAVWLSVSNDLKFDAQRDLVDIGSDKIKVHALNKLKYTRISSKKNARIKKGVIFSTYSSLIGESQQKTTKKKYNSRLKQLLHWLGGESFDGVIVFDECHKAKNLVPYGSSKPTKTGLAVLELQERLPNARIIYASATGASEPKNMAYMVRLGLWGPQTPFRDFNDFIQSIEKRGVGAMEILAMDMKLRGMYMARQLSFAGVSFRVEEIPLDEEYIAIYNDSVRLWVEMKERFQEALDLVDPEGSGNKQLKKTVWCQFWSSHQRFFKYLCMACKVPHVVELAQRALIDNKCVVIGLQSTGEARTLDQLDDYGALSGGEFISTARGVLQNLVERHFPSLEHQQQQQTQKGSANGSKNSQRVNDILQRLSTYTNSAAHSNGTKRSKIKSKGSRKYGRHSSVSSSSSLDSDPAVSTGSFNDENDDPLDDEDEGNDDEQSSNFDDDDSDSAAVDDDDFDDDDDDEDDDDDDEDDEDELSSDDSEAKKPDAIVVKTEKTATKVSADNRRKNMTMKKIDDDEDWSLIKTTTAVDSTENAASVSNDGGFESDDSDDLFSITKSVSVQSLITMNNLQQKKRSLLNSDEKREKSSNKKRKTDETTTKKDRRSPPVMDFIPRRAANRPKPTNDHEMREYIYEMKSDLLIAIQRLGRRLPANTLDQLIDMLEGPENVAEMTGRKGRVVQQKNSDETGSTYVYESRNEADVPVELMNVIQKERFMNGDKLIAIISEAASSGISLQANRRCANQYRRVHITLELPWSADRAIQQFGRTHRSNQVHAPEYVFLISELAGEKRFASTVAKRLESLGALTHGDRRATETRDLSRFNIDNKYGRAAVENVLRSICGLEKPQAQWPSSPANFMQEARQALMGVGLITADPVNSSSMSSVHYWPEKDATQINRFLNRLLGCPVTLQNAIFQFFTDVMSAVILEAKRSGRWDLGILDLGCSNGSEENSDQQPSLVETKLFRLVNHDNFDSATKRVIEMHTVMVERGLTWHRALDIYEAARAKGLDAHFYLSNQVKTTNNSQHRVVLLAVSNENNNPNTTSHKTPTTTANKSPCYLIYKPNTGLQTRLETSDSLEKKFTPIGGGIEEARSYWEAHYERSSNECIHKVRLGSCRRSVRCELGLRTRRYYIMAGAVLAVWTRVEQAVEALTGTSQYRLQIIRVKTSDGRKIVGCVIPGQCVRRVSQLLASLSHCDSDETKTTDFVHSVATTATTTPTSDEFVIS